MTLSPHLEAQIYALEILALMVAADNAIGIAMAEAENVDAARATRDSLALEWCRACRRAADIKKGAVS